MRRHMLNRKRLKYTS